MKSTGVIRRIDELGRIVIPKEIRRHLGIRDGESLEIFTEEDKIVLKKYSRMLEYSDLSKKICELVPSIMDYALMVTDRDKIISYSDNIKLNLENITLNQNMISNIQEREIYESTSFEKIIIGEYEIEGYFYFQPIISSTDCLGLVILVKDKMYTKEEKLFAKFISELIANKIDIS